MICRRARRRVRLSTGDGSSRPFSADLHPNALVGTPGRPRVVPGLPFVAAVGIRVGEVVSSASAVFGLASLSQHRRTNPPDDEVALVDLIVERFPSRDWSRHDAAVVVLGEVQWMEHVDD